MSKQNPIPAPAVGSRRRRAAFVASDSGVTLIELLVVLAIIVLFASLAGPQVLRYLGTAKADTAKAQITSLMTAVELYYIDIGAYPPSALGLKALIEPPSGVMRWRGPYLRQSSGLVDPWGRAYLYRAPGQQRPFEIISWGRDGQPGGTGEDGDQSSR